ncbi:DUF4395 domain-containing protein [Cohnella caldifontis]|uniref:DUF4395 domain-containing protein n=1 Tax=Cohnella caldifontis TaxID=3027471 RepID=UPI0023ED58C0|nr:DUF4395 domain-containing protein [Cohnella sp. YIM B05605]
MEIPMSYVKANQVGIVVLVILSFVFTPWILLALWLIELAGLLSGGRYNLFVRVAKPFLHPEGKETQAAELTRFNNALAVIFLTLSVLSFSLGWPVAGIVFAAMLLAAAGAALLGYCIGCTVYFQYKQFRHRFSR